ncbi:MAG: bile acid:sodium symporter family protein [Acidimicrobiales bacterium]
MDAVTQIFNIVLVVFIVATMLSAGFNTTFEQLTSVYRRWQLVLMVVVVGFVIRPLVGWGTAELFGLATPAFIAMVLLWSCPGAPFGSKLVMTAKANIQTGAVLQVTLAALGSLTFAPTANAIVSAADLGDDISLPVADLIKTVAFLQLVPFAVGLMMRHWASDTALDWDKTAAKLSSYAFLLVLVGAVLGSWETMVELIGSRVLLAAIVASVVMIIAGYFLSTGKPATKQAAALIEPCSNSGPAFAAVGIAFGNDPDILGAITAILALQIVVGLATASFWAKDNAGAVTTEPAPIAA